MKVSHYFIVIVSLLLIGCSSLRVEKKRYSKGYHVSLNKKIVKKTSEKKEVELSVVEQSPMSAFQEMPYKIPINNQDEWSDSGITKERGSISFKVQEAEREKQEMEAVTKSLKKKTIGTKVKKNKSQAAIAQEHSLGAKSLLFFLFSLSAPLFFLFSKNRKLSKWAAKNVTKARFSIAGIHVGIFISALLLGMLSSVSFSPLVIPIITVSTIISLLVLLPHKQSSTNENVVRIFFKRNLLAAGNAFSAFVYGGSNNLIEAVDNSLLIHPLLAVLLTLLLTAVLIGLFILLANLSCNLACSGYGALAVFVFVGGTYLLLFLYLLAMIYVYKKESSDTKSFAKKAAVGAFFAVLLLGVLMLLNSI